MFIGGAIEQTAKECCIRPGMSGHQVREGWGRPDQITISDTLFPNKCATSVVCVWTYRDPYRLVVFEDGCVVRVFERELRSYHACERVY